MHLPYLFHQALICSPFRQEAVHPLLAMGKHLRILLAINGDESKVSVIGSSMFHCSMVDFPLVHQCEKPECSEVAFTRLGDLEKHSDKVHREYREFSINTNGRRPTISQYIPVRLVGASGFLESNNC